MKGLRCQQSNPSVAAMTSALWGSPRIRPADSAAASAKSRSPVCFATPERRLGSLSTGLGEQARRGVRMRFVCRVN